jgi:hypothetical protein
MVATALIALGFAVAPACSKPCEPGQSHCEGRDLRTCGRPCEDCDIDWLPAVPCEGACITEGAAQAFCSLTENPDPRCAGRAAYCDDDWRIGCHGGYRVSQIRCEPPVLPGKAECVELASGLACRVTGSAPPADAGARDVASDALGLTAK